MYTYRPVYCSSVLRRVAVRFQMPLVTAVCCSVLQCVAVLQCFAVCCSVTQCVAVKTGRGSEFQCVLVCCSVLPCVAVC